MDIDLGNRLFEFAVQVIKYCRGLKKSKENDVIKYQLIKSATSSGANYEEAQSASSKQDFKYKIDLSLREIREANYWLRILSAVDPPNTKLNYLMNESHELKNILGSISSKIFKSKKNKT